MAAPVSHFDIFATALAAAGVPLATDRKINGAGLRPTPGHVAPQVGGAKFRRPFAPTPGTTSTAPSAPAADRR
jgi:arylsulfatase A-like enzyme